MLIVCHFYTFAHVRTLIATANIKPCQEVSCFAENYHDCVLIKYEKFAEYLIQQKAQSITVNKDIVKSKYLWR